MEKDRQIFQLHQKGYENIEKSLKDLKPNPEAVQKVEILGAQVITIKGDPGEKGDPGYTPKKGADYFTAREIKEISDDIFSRIKIPEPIPGKDAVVDYASLKKYIVAEVSKIKIPEPVPGKDAVVDYKSIVETVLGRIPKTKVDYISVEKTIVEHIRKMEERIVPRYRTLNSGGPTTRLGELVDVNIEGVVDGQALIYNAELGRWVPGAGGGGGAVDSIQGLTGVVLLDTDDIPEGSTNLYFTAGRAQSAMSGLYEVPLTFTTGLTRATNTVTANLSTGVAGGQTAIGGTASGENLTLSSTSHATKGKIILGASYYDEVNNRLGINNSTPYASLVVTGTSATTARMGFAYSNTYGQTYWTADFSSGSQNSNALTGYINQIGGTGSQWIQVLGNATVTFSNNVTTSGVFYAGTGSATFPSLSFGSDSNTGIYRSAIDTLAFATNGTFRGSINSAGTLTIGAGTVSAIPQNTSSTFVPAIGAFTTSGSAGISAGVTDGTNNRRAGLFVNQTDAIWGLSHSYSSGRIPFVILSNTTEQLRVDTSHNMGLGVTNVKARIHSAVDVAGGTHNASLIINNVNAGTGGLGTGPYTGIDFSHLNNQASDIQRKASIGFEKITTFSRGDLVVAICGTADNTNVNYLTDEKLRLTMDGNLGVGTIGQSVAARIHAISTTEQLRLGVSGSIWASVTVAATTGVTTFDSVGGSTPSFVFADAVTFNETVTLVDAKDIATGTATGSKIFVTNTQKGAFWGATPIVQPTTSVASATFVANASVNFIYQESTFDGYKIEQVVKALRNEGLLA